MQNVQRLAEFYRDVLGLTLVEEIENEWAVFSAGSCQLALHRAGGKPRVLDPGRARETNNAKIVLSVQTDLTALRDKLVAAGVEMGRIKSFPGFTGPLCDGIDPEGNVFQLAQV